MQEDEQGECRAPIGQGALEQQMIGSDAQKRRQIEEEEQYAALFGEREDNERADDGDEPCCIAVAEVMPAPHGRAQEYDQQKCKRHADEEEGGESGRERDVFRRHGAACAEP